MNEIIPFSTRFFHDGNLFKFKELRWSILKKTVTYRVEKLAEDLRIGFIDDYNSRCSSADISSRFSLEQPMIILFMEGDFKS